MKRICKQLIVLTLISNLVVSVPTYALGSFDNQSNILNFCSKHKNFASPSKCNHLQIILRHFISGLKQKENSGKSLSYLEEKKLVTISKFLDNEPLKASEYFLIETIVNNSII